ncbi:hypothetical protein LG298_10300 [Cytobacillus firmus]|uniref:hypothetical protein n=1 Tax=Cytobacillus firmus TaxID=1399 RepID=UPI003850AB18
MGLNVSGFKKITRYNGFDSTNKDNAMQNNYAWSVAEFGEYLYVGTGRNIVYSVLSSGAIFGDIEVPEELTPKNPDFSGEIWRYRKDGCGEWERVFKEPSLGIVGFRFMISYKSPSGEKALYAGCATFSPNLLVLKYTDEEGWRPLPSLLQGGSTRTMVVHNNKLYMAALPGNELQVSNTLLYVSEDPEQNGWEQIDLSGDPKKNPQGNGIIMSSFNNRLYIGTALPEGFQLWRSEDENPGADRWVKVVDKGAGDARNEVPLSLEIFKGYLYLGTAVYFGIFSLDPNDRLVTPKGFDLIRINKNDQWELVIGSKPVEQSNPETGTRGTAISGIPSGFGNIANGYCWQLKEYNGWLYLGTWDWTDLIPPLLPEVLKSLWSENPLLRSLPIECISDLFFALISPATRLTFGFSLWKSPDGIHWFPVTINGLGNPKNYGCRNLFVSENGNLYLGTANPFEGCEVWVKEKKNCLDPLKDMLGKG